MINKTDLRLNNSVLLNGEEYKIEGLVDTAYISNNDTTYIEKRYSEIEGVPINEDRLLKAGFVECKSPYSDQKAYSIFQNRGMLIWSGDNVFKISSDGSFRFITRPQQVPHKDICEYWHQLQNIVHALTGEEI